MPVRQNPVGCQVALPLQPCWGGRRRLCWGPFPGPPPQRKSLALLCTTPGCPLQKPTFILLNLALLGCIGLLGSLLVHVEAELQLHFAVLLALAIGLLISVNW